MKNLAIVGATGLVGQTLLRILKEENIVCDYNLFLFVSDRSANKVLVFNGNHYRLMSLTENIFQMNLDYAIFVADETISKIWVPKFLKNNITVIDNSSAFRMQKDIPLVVPEINFRSIISGSKLIANPNCSTIQLVVVLDRLQKLSKINRICVSSYQSVSGAGKLALNDLINGTNCVFEKGIKNNFIAQIGSIVENGNCTEENKLINETNKILNENIDIIATTVRVPISYCHGESVYVEFEKEIDFEKIREILDCEYIEYSDGLIYPTDCENSNKTFVFRLRKIDNHRIVFFCLANNLRRGAAYNAVEILKRLNQ